MIAKIVIKPLGVSVQIAQQMMIYWRIKVNWVVVLLLIVITLQLLIKFPIEITLIEKQECPEVICRDVTATCNVNIINKTVIEIEPIEIPNIQWNWFVNNSE